MMATPPQGPVVRGKPQPNVYTMLLIVAIVVLIATVGIVIHNLMTVYGLSFADLFKVHKIPPGQ